MKEAESIARQLRNEMSVYSTEVLLSSGLMKSPSGKRFGY